MALNFTPYCTDEDVAVRACGDFAVLCPSWQVLAKGTDGAFAGDNLWTLTSVSQSFAGVGVGNVVLLRAPRPTFSGAGALFGVAAQASGAVTLKQLGQAAGVGLPPSPAGGLTAVDFVIATLQPQIGMACLDVNNQLGIDPQAMLFNPSQIYDPNSGLNQLTVLTVLQRQYAMEARTDRGDFAMKLKQVNADLSAVKARTTVQWGSKGQANSATGLFSTQLRR